MREYALFLGCLVANRVAQFEASAVKVLESLGVRVRYIDGFTCCPDPFSLRMLNEKVWYAIAARNICLVEEAGVNILTLCSGCNATLFRVNRDLKLDAGLRVETNKILKEVGKEFKGEISVESILRVLYEDVGINEIKNHIKNSLEGVKVTLHYGCHIFEELKDFDDVKNPKSLKKLVESTGAKVLNYSNEMQCCGYFMQFVDRNFSRKILEEKLSSIAESSADCLIVICPSCFLQFDVGQASIARKTGKAFKIPVLYLPQLLGLAMGLSPQNLGLQYHSIKGAAFIT